MKIWLDTEFMEDGRTIDLLSIGLVREDGLIYYAESAEADRRNANDWVQANVIPHLHGPVKPRAHIAQDLEAFVYGDDGRPVEFWAWYADYDWVAVCQLFGRMVDLPDGWPMYCNDFKQEADRLGLGHMPEHDVDLDGPEHNALADAMWLRRVSAKYLNAGA